jgi:Phytanoyl-CoA dioxygenase (PhyH)
VLGYAAEVLLTQPTCYFRTIIPREPGLPHTDTFAERGIAIFEYVLTPSDIAVIDAAFPALGPRIPGARSAAFTAEMRHWFATHASLLELSGRLLGAPAHLARVQAFDKSATANWFVPWHQDRAEDGHERSLEVLEHTVALRIHLDACDENNGPLEVIPGSHRHGRLDADAIAGKVTETASLLCLTARGDIVAMRPLLIHRSQRAKTPSARRVVHLEYTGVRRLG